MTDKTKKPKKELQEACGIALTPSLIAKALRIGDGNKSAGVRAALEAYPEEQTNTLQRVSLHVSRTPEGEYVAHQVGSPGWREKDTTAVFTVTLTAHGNFAEEGKEK